MHRSLYKVFGWPVVQITFLFKGKPVAILTLAKARNTWFALPHSDTLGFWLSPECTSISNFPAMINSSLKAISLDDILKNGNKRTIELEQESINSTTQYPSKLSIRSTLPLLDFRVGNKVVSTLLLCDSIENQMKLFTGNLRRKIRKAHKNDVKVKYGGSELMNDFYTIYRSCIHDHGSFGLPKSFFVEMFEEKESKLKSEGNPVKRIGNEIMDCASTLFVAYIHGKPVGSALLVDFLDTSENIAFSTIPAFNCYYTGYALHHAMIGRAISRGRRKYSFGRSTVGSGVHAYKKQWGTVCEPLYLNSIEPAYPINYRILGSVIKHLPSRFVRPFDYLVTRLIY